MMADDHMTLAHLSQLLAALPDDTRAKLLHDYLMIARKSERTAWSGALHNAMPVGFVEVETDKIIGRVAELVRDQQAALVAQTGRYLGACKNAHDLSASLSRAATKLDEVKAERDLAVQAHAIATRYGAAWRDKYEAANKAHEAWRTAALWTDHNMPAAIQRAREATAHADRVAEMIGNALPRLKET